MFCKVNFFTYYPHGKDYGIGNYVNSIQGSATINIPMVSSFISLVKRPDESLEAGFFLYSKLIMNNGDVFYIDSESYEKLEKAIAKVNTK